MGRWHVLREPAVPILLAATVVHIVRRDMVDILVFAGTAVLIAVDAGRAPRSPGAARAVARPARWWAAAGMTLYAIVVALAPAASFGARAAVVATGVAAAVVLFLPAQGLEREADQPRATPRGWLVWAVIGVITCLWELTSFIWGQVSPDDAESHPAVSDLVGPLLETWFGRAVFLLMWAAAGWWLVRMVRAPAAPGAGTGAAGGAAADDRGSMPRHEAVEARRCEE